MKIPRLFQLPWLTVLGLAFATAGCALTSKGTALSPRYFSPDLARPGGTSAGAADASSHGALELRLGQVEAASHLEERMAYRLNASELGYYEDRLWTEQPSEYLRRALERELFEQNHLRRVVTGAADTLDVELTSLEELRSPSPRVRLALSYTLHDARESMLERSIVVERPLAAGNEADKARRVAAALGEALEQAVTEVSQAVTPHLQAPEVTPCAPPEVASPREAVDGTRPRDARSR